MTEIMTMGEIIVEIMRSSVDQPLDRPGIFKGPYPSGAPAIFIDTVARLGHRAAIAGGVGEDDFGKCLLDRLEHDGVDCSCIIKNDRISTGCAFVTYFSDGERKFIFHIGNTPAVLAPVPAAEKLQGLKYFHIMGCSLMADIPFGRRIVEAMECAAGQGAKISFDPNIRPELLKDPEAMELVSAVLEQTSIFMPGKSELKLLSGCDDKEDSLNATISYTDPTQAVDFYHRTGIDIFAIAIGTAHGFYKGEPKLNFELLAQIKDLLDCPLVLHGGSGIPDEMIRRTIVLGINKVNYATELRAAATLAVRQALTDESIIDPKKYMGKARDAVRTLCLHKIDVCGSAGKI